MQTLERIDRPPAWNDLPSAVQIISEAGRTIHVRATSLFRDLERHARNGVPLLQVNIDGRPIAEASVGALNLYLGTAGLRGLARRLGVSWPRTRWDWEALASLIGLGNVAQSARRAG